jgi:HEAT repeat protein
MLCRHMADAGVIEALLPLLQSDDADTRDAVAVALAHIASNVDARKKVWSAGAVTPLVRGLSTLGFRGVEGAAVCLEKLVALKEAAEQLASEPVCPLLYTPTHVPEEHGCARGASGAF